jgi:hypothetical protein
MSGPLIDLIVELFREYVDDPAPVTTADYIDGSVNCEDLNYAAYRFRQHFMPLPDSVLITSVECTREAPRSKGYPGDGSVVHKIQQRIQKAHAA